jgi:hypothetical protein
MVLPSRGGGRVGRRRRLKPKPAPTHRSGLRVFEGCASARLIPIDLSVLPAARALQPPLLALHGHPRLTGGADGVARSPREWKIDCIVGSRDDGPYSRTEDFDLQELAWHAHRPLADFEDCCVGGQAHDLIPCPATEAVVEVALDSSPLGSVRHLTSLCVGRLEKVDEAIGDSGDRDHNYGIADVAKDASTFRITCSPTSFLAIPQRLMR